MIAEEKSKIEILKATVDRGGEEQDRDPEGEVDAKRVHLTTPERCWFGLVDNSPVAATKGLGMDFETTALNLN